MAAQISDNWLPKGWTDCLTTARVFENARINTDTSKPLRRTKSGVLILPSILGNYFSLAVPEITVYIETG